MGYFKTKRLFCTNRFTKPLNESDYVKCTLSPCLVGLSVGCGPAPWLGVCERQPVNVFLPLVLPPFPSLYNIERFYKDLNKIFKKT